MPKIIYYDVISIYLLLAWHQFLPQSSQIKMEGKPTEILMTIFQQLIRLEDIVKCSNTCERWNEIIKELFKDKGTFHIEIFIE